MPEDLTIDPFTRCDVSELNKELQTIHQAPYLAFNGVENAVTVNDETQQVAA